jgi:hypothetical protein
MISTFLAEYLVDCLGVLIANVRELGCSLLFDLFVVDHVQEHVSLLVADAGVSSF